MLRRIMRNDVEDVEKGRRPRLDSEASSDGSLVLSNDKKRASLFRGNSIRELFGLVEKTE